MVKNILQKFRFLAAQNNIGVLLCRVSDEKKNCSPHSFISASNNFSMLHVAFMQLFFYNPFDVLRYSSQYGVTIGSFAISGTPTNYTVQSPRVIRVFANERTP